MLLGLPVTQDEAAGVPLNDIENGYSSLSVAQKKRWLKSASASGGCIRLSTPADPAALQICVFNSNSGSYDLGCWIDRDPFDIV